MEMSNDPECQVLGALLLDQSCIFQVQEVLSVDDFKYAKHQVIYNAIIKLGDECDIFTCWAEIESDGIHISYLSDMTDCCPTTKNVLAYAHVVLESGRQRKLKLLSQLIIEAQQSKEKSEVILDRVGEALSSISTNGIGNTQTTLNDALKEVVEQVGERMDGIGEVYKTGFDELDESMPLESGMLYFLGGLSAMGKTTLLQSLIEHQIFNGIPVYFNSAEMSAAQVAKRFLQSAGSIESNFFKDPAKHMSTQIGQSMTAGLLKLKDRNLLIDDEQGLTSSALKVRARNWITSQESYKKNGKAMLVVDYIQLMDHDHRSTSTSLGKITKDLRSLAKEMKIPVLILGQLNNDYKTRSDKRPIPSDIAGSGEIFRDSDGVIFCYRDEVFNEDTPDRGVMEIVMGKNRDGNIGTVRASAEMCYYRVRDIKNKY